MDSHTPRSMDAIVNSFAKKIGFGLWPVHWELTVHVFNLRKKLLGHGRMIAGDWVWCCGGFRSQSCRCRGCRKWSFGLRWWWRRHHLENYAPNDLTTTICNLHGNRIRAGRARSSINHGRLRRIGQFPSLCRPLKRQLVSIGRDCQTSFLTRRDCCASLCLNLTHLRRSSP